MLFKPTPVATGLYVSDSLSSNPVVGRDESRDAIVSPDCSNLLPRQLGKSMPLSARSGVVANGVLHVAGSAIPSQVAHMIVGPVAVVMAGLRAFWRGANKSRQDQAMDIARRLPVVLPEVDHWVFAGGGQRLRNDSLSQRQSSSGLVRYNPRQRLDSSAIAYLVNTFKTINRFPLFFHAKAPVNGCLRAKCNLDRAGILYGI